MIDKFVNKDKIILDLCGGTGAWSKPYKEAGYDVRLITLPENDVRTYMPPNNVYGIFAAPPCTMFSLARTRAKTPRDLKQGMEIVIACLNIIWECRYKKRLEFWTLENPMGYLRQFLGKPIFTYNPYEFALTKAEAYTKKTDLWGYFNNPKKDKRLRLEIWLTSEEIKKVKQNIRKLPSISEITGSTQADKRAITPSGFAQAFFKANK